MTSSHSRPAQWPVDPDVAADDIVGPGAPGRAPQRALHLRRIGMVLLGGFVGGLARDEVVTHWPSAPGRFPWSVFVVNTAGAFVLGLVVIVVLDVLAGSRYLRALAGAGFCGALTTFGSVAVAVDQLLRHGHPGTAIAYLVSSTAAALAAAAAGAVTARALPPTAARRAQGAT